MKFWKLPYWCRMFFKSKNCILSIDSEVFLQTSNGLNMKFAHLFHLINVNFISICNLIFLKKIWKILNHIKTFVNLSQNLEELHFYSFTIKKIMNIDKISTLMKLILQEYCCGNIFKNLNNIKEILKIYLMLLKIMNKINLLLA